MTYHRFGLSLPSSQPKSLGSSSDMGWGKAKGRPVPLVQKPQLKAGAKIHRSI